MITFASDNFAPVHPDIMSVLNSVNTGYAMPYGGDEYTAAAEKMLKKLFNADISAFFVFNGTGSNTVALDAIAKPYNAILAGACAHIYVDECGSPQRHTGASIKLVRHDDGKVTPADLAPFLADKGVVHKSQPGVLSISQITESGEAYTIAELKALSEFCKEHGLYIHMDGSRLVNAALTLNPSDPKQILKDTIKYVDVLCFGLTKNGAMIAESIIIKDKKLAENFIYCRKQGFQLASKMRYISAQFTALLENDLWIQLAKNANDKMKKLYLGIKDINGVEFTNSVDGNLAFLNINTSYLETLEKDFYFYHLEDGKEVTKIRLITSWCTTDDDVDAFINAVKKLAK